MDGIAGTLRRKIRDVEIDIRLGLTRVLIVTQQKLARPEDIEGLLVECLVGPVQPSICEGRELKAGRGGKNSPREWAWSTSAVTSMSTAAIPKRSDPVFIRTLPPGRLSR